jgi:putative ABC transport system permease protein
MTFVALKMLMGDRLKYISLVAGLAFAALLVTQQAAIFSGYTLRTGSWIRDTRCADLWVMNDQTEFVESGDTLLDTALDRVRGVDGVLWAVPLYRGQLKTRLPDGTETMMRVVGLDDATLLGGPPYMVQGKLADLRRDGAILINADQMESDLLLKRANPPRPLSVGDSISVNDHNAVVMGTYRPTPDFFWFPMVYTTYSRAIQMAPRQRQTNTFVLVKAQPGVALADLAGRIGKIPGLKALTSEQFERMTMDYVLNKTGILVNFGITIGLGFLIGVLVSGQTLYTFILDNVRHFAALKAMGAGTRALIGMVGLQSATAGGIGYGIGVGGAALTGWAFARIGLAFEMPWQIPVMGASAIVLCCFAAAIFGLMRVLRVDPAIVFKG